MLDVMASTRLYGKMLTSNGGDFIETCHKVAGWYYQWEKLSDLEIHYGNPILDDIEEILTLLDLRLHHKTKLRIANNIETMPLGGKTRAITLLSSNHKNNGGTGYYKEVLSDKEIKYIKANFPLLIESK